MRGDERAARATPVCDASVRLPAVRTPTRVVGDLSRRKPALKWACQWIRQVLTPERLTLTAIVLVAACLRLSQFPHLPAGLNQDEADAGYDAYALLLRGTDKWGNHLPVYLPAWGSGQNALLSYLDIPFIRLLGLNVFAIRLLPALLGIVSVPLLYATVKRLHGALAAALASLFLAVLPWHVMLSRWSLESNLLPFCLLMGVWLVARTYRSERLYRLIPFALIPFALALYAYAVAIVIVPPLVGLLLLENRTVVRRHVRAVAVSVVLACTIAVPFLAFLAVNFVLHREPAVLRVLPISIPLLPGNRIAQNAGSIPALLYNVVFLLRSFDDGLAYNALPGFPPLGFLCLPLAVIGIWLPRRRGSRESMTFLIWLVCCLPLLTVTSLNIDRANALFIPLIALAAIGTVEVAKLPGLAHASHTRHAVVAIAVGATLAYSLLFCCAYFSPTNHSADGAFNVGLDTALTRADSAARQGEPIYVSDSIALNYVYVLFYTRADPRDFSRSVSYTIMQGTYHVEAYRRYVFLPDSSLLAQGTSYVYIIKRDELPTCRTATPLWTGRGWIVGRCVND